MCPLFLKDLVSLGPIRSVSCRFHSLEMDEECPVILWPILKNPNFSNQPSFFRMRKCLIYPRGFCQGSRFFHSFGIGWRISRTLSGYYLTNLQKSKFFKFFSLSDSGKVFSLLELSAHEVKSFHSKLVEEYPVLFLDILWPNFK